jgi:vacuolar-type H+-ATPase subunit I/STV1
MSENQEVKPEVDDTTSTTTQTESDNKSSDDTIQKLIDERLKPMKENLDRAYKSRDEALKKIQEFEKKQREEEIKRLQEEGKHREAYEMQLAEERTKREALEKRNIELTRDLEVKTILSDLDFRNDKARDLAFSEVVKDLVQNQDGKWVHRSGISLNDFIKSFGDNQDNSFLFKQKVSSGSGTTSRISPSSSTQKSSLFEMSQDEVLKLAREGKLPSRKT